LSLGTSSSIHATTTATNLIVLTDDSKQQLKSWQRETTSISKCHKAVVEATMPLLHYQQFLVVGVAFLAV
jgi:hypothetical protein